LLLLSHLKIPGQGFPEMSISMNFKKNRRLAFSNILTGEVLTEQLEERFLPVINPNLVYVLDGHGPPAKGVHIVDPGSNYSITDYDPPGLNSGWRLALTQNGLMFTGTSYGTLEAYDMNQKKALWSSIAFDTTVSATRVSGMAYYNDKSLYVSSELSGTLFKIDTTTMKVNKTFGQNNGYVKLGQKSLGVSCDAAGTVYVCVDNNIAKVSADGAIVNSRFIQLSETATDVFADSTTSRIYVSRGSSVDVFDFSGNLIKKQFVTTNYRISDILVDSSLNNLYVNDYSYNPNIDVFASSTGTFVRQIKNVGINLAQMVNAVPDNATSVNMRIYDGNNQSAAVMSNFSKNLSVQIMDSFGYPVANKFVTFTVSNSGPSATIAGSNIVKTDANGIAVCPVLTSNSIAGSFTVTASSSGLSSSVFYLSNVGSTPATLSILTGNGQSAVVGTAYQMGLQVIVTDAFNNPLNSVPVTFSLPQSGPGIVSASNNVVYTGITGKASFVNFFANNIAGAFSVNASVANLPPVSFIMNNTASTAASLIAVSGGSQSTITNRNFASPLQVKVVDSYGNPIPYIPVTFNVPKTGASLIINGNIMGWSDNNGIVVSPSLTSNAIMGSYKVTATSPGLPSIGFSMTNVAPRIQSIIIQQGALGRSYIRYVDIILNDSETAKLIVNSVSNLFSRVSLTNMGVNGRTRRFITLKGLVRNIGSTIRFDFGSTGIGGSPGSRQGDGSYLISMDLDGNGTQETTQKFWRLHGDVNGDKVVNLDDTSLVKRFLGGVGANATGDTNGDARVDIIDSNNVRKAFGRRISI
jgi:hypothetical protein